jgi:hypothetical protein
VGSDDNEFNPKVRVIAIGLEALTVYRFDEPSLEEKEWIAALKLSTMWELREIRGNAIEKLHEYVRSKPVDQILLGSEYHVSPWMLEGYKSLITKAVENDEQLNSYGDSLGWKTTATILFYRRKGGSITEDVIRKAFKIPY